MACKVVVTLILPPSMDGAAKAEVSTTLKVAKVSHYYMKMIKNVIVQSTIIPETKKLFLILRISKWLSVHLRTKWLWVRISLQSLKAISVEITSDITVSGTK